MIIPQSHTLTTRHLNRGDCKLNCVSKEKYY